MIAVLLPVGGNRTRVLDPGISYNGSELDRYFFDPLGEHVLNFKQRTSKTLLVATVCSCYSTLHVEGGCFELAFWLVCSMHDFIP